MRLLQLNVWGGRLMESVIDLVRELDPAVICMQEVISTDVPMVFGTLEDLVAALEFDHVHFAPTFHFDIMGGDAEFGNVILSRYPMSNQETVFFNLEYARSFSFSTHDYNIRNFVRADLDTPDGTLHVVNYHGLQVPEHKNGTEQTERNCLSLAHYLKPLIEEPTLLTGDFNLAPTSISLVPLDRLMTNHCKAAGVTSTRTRLTRKNEVCDYVFSSAAVTASDFRLSDQAVSDHCALVMDFEI